MGSAQGSKNWARDDLFYPESGLEAANFTFLPGGLFVAPASGLEKANFTILHFYMEVCSGV